MSKLSSCPFCGLSDGEHVNFIITQSPETVNTPAYSVKCLGCGAWGLYGASNGELAVEGLAETHRRRQTRDE